MLRFVLVVFLVLTIFAFVRILFLVASFFFFAALAAVATMAFLARTTFLCGPGFLPCVAPSADAVACLVAADTFPEGATVFCRPSLSRLAGVSEVDALFGAVLIFTGVLSSLVEVDGLEGVLAWLLFAALFFSALRAFLRVSCTFFTKSAFCQRHDNQ